MSFISRKAFVVPVAALALAACTRTEPAPSQVAQAESDLRVTDTHDTRAPVVATDHTHPSQVTWKTFDTMQEVVAASDLVVHGRVVAQRPAAMRLYPYNASAGRPMTPAEAGSEYTDVPLTVSTIEVVEVVRSKLAALALGGGNVTRGTQVEIIELGGILPDGCLSQPSDKPLIGRSDEAVYLLSSASRPGAYHVVGGWQGRMNVRAGVVRPLASEVHPSAAELTQYAGRSVEEFKAAVKAMRVD